MNRRDLLRNLCLFVWQWGPIEFISEHQFKFTKLANNIKYPFRFSSASAMTHMLCFNILLLMKWQVLQDGLILYPMAGSNVPSRVLFDWFSHYWFVFLSFTFGSTLVSFSFSFYYCQLLFFIHNSTGKVDGPSDATACLNTYQLVCDYSFFSPRSLLVCFPICISYAYKYCWLKRRKVCHQCPTVSIRGNQIYVSSNITTTTT